LYYYYCYYCYYYIGCQTLSVPLRSKTRIETIPTAQVSESCARSATKRPLLHHHHCPNVGLHNNINIGDINSFLVTAPDNQSVVAFCGLPHYNIVIIMIITINYIIMNIIILCISHGTARNEIGPLEQSAQHDGDFNYNTGDRWAGI